MIRSRSSRIASNGSPSSGAEEGSIAAVSPGDTRASTGNSSTRSR
jgi:hypothetical protein